MQENKFRISRVMVNGAEAKSPDRAEVDGVLPDIVFVRKDGWSLGAPFTLEPMAYAMWEDEWSHFFYTRKADVPQNWRLQMFAIEAYDMHVEVRGKIALALLKAMLEGGE